MSILKRVASNAVLSGCATIWKILISIVLTPYLIHSLGVPVYGIWVLAVSFSVYGYMSLFSCGLQGALVKQVAEYKARGEFNAANEAFRATLLAFSVLGLLGCASLLLLVDLIVGHLFQVPVLYVEMLRVLLSLAAIQLLPDFPGLVFAGVLEGDQRYDILAICELIRGAIFAIAAVVCVSMGFGVVSLGFLLLGISILNTVVLALVSRILLPWLRPLGHITYDSAVPLLRLSAKLFLLRINAVVYSQMDKAILAMIISTTVLTDYDLTARFHAFVTMAMGLISSVLMPTSAALHATQDTRRLRLLFLTGTKYSAIMSIPLTLTLMILAGPILQSWVGSQFVVVSSLVRLALLYTLFWVLVQVGWNVMIGMDKVNTILRIQYITTAINLTASIVLTQRIGIAGVFLGTLVGNTIAWIWYMCIYLRVLEVGAGEFFREVIAKSYPQAFIGALLLQLGVLYRQPESLIEVGIYGAAGIGTSMVLFTISGVTAEERNYVGIKCREWWRAVAFRQAR